MKHVAISHMYVFSYTDEELGLTTNPFRWSGGMGNQIRNSVPTYQLFRVQQMSNSMYSHKVASKKTGAVLDRHSSAIV
jgi:hypothetical protein